MSAARAEFFGESFGTFLLVLFGCGSVAASVLTGAQVGIFQVAIVWGIAIALAIQLTSSLSGAHLNPAVTLALASDRRVEWRTVPRYVFAQLVGAIAAAAVLHLVYGGALVEFETAQHIVRGHPGSEASAMIFGEYFPNPAWKTIGAGVTSHFRAFATEGVGTAILMVSIFGITEPKNSGKTSVHAPWVIGLTVTILISLFGPLTQAAFNPARDLGPRVYSSLVGWGLWPFQANGWGWLTVYVIAPIVGAQAGWLTYRLILRPGYFISAQRHSHHTAQ